MGHLLAKMDHFNLCAARAVSKKTDRKTKLKPTRRPPSRATQKKDSDYRRAGEWIERGSRSRVVAVRPAGGPA